MRLTECNLSLIYVICGEFGELWSDETQFLVEMKTIIL